MLNAEGCDPRIMNPPASNLTGFKQLTQRRPMLVRFGQQHERRRFEPRVNLVARGWERRRRIINSWMRHDREKFVHAWPGDRPSGAAFREAGKMPRRDGVKRRVLAVCINEDIGVDGDQGRPS
jgi:hypothetical protein